MPPFPPPMPLAECMCNSMILKATRFDTIAALGPWLGLYAKLNPLGTASGGRAVYKHFNTSQDAFLYYQPTIIDWTIGPSPFSNAIWIENDNDINAVCPNEGAQSWRYWDGTQWKLAPDLQFEGGCSPSPPPPPLSPGYSCLCSNECRKAGTQTVSRLPLASDGYCDDGGPGAEDGLVGEFCEYGTDCLDCGPRCSLMPPPLPPFPPPPPTSTCACDTMVLEVMGTTANAIASQAYLAQLLGTYTKVPDVSASAHSVYYNNNPLQPAYLYLAANLIWAVGPNYNSPSVYMENTVFQQGVQPGSCPDESAIMQSWAYWAGTAWANAATFRVRAGCPPPPSPCIDSYIVPHGNTVSVGKSEYIQLPTINGIHSISMWFYVETEQDIYPWDYLLDARGSGLSNGWVSYNSYPLLKFGSAWKRVVIHSMDGTPVIRKDENVGNGQIDGFNLPGGRWMHMYLESKVAAWRDDISIFSRYQESNVPGGREDLDGRFASIAMWHRDLTSAEIDDLVAGGLGPTRDANSPLVASYHSDYATYTNAATQYRIPENTGSIGHNWGDGTTETAGLSTQVTIKLFTPYSTYGTLPTCLPILRPGNHMPNVGAGDDGGATVWIILVVVAVVGAGGAYYVYRKLFRKTSTNGRRVVNVEGLRSSLNAGGTLSDAFSLPPISSTISLTNTPLVSSPGTIGVTGGVVPLGASSANTPVAASPLNASCFETPTNSVTRNTAALQRARRFSRRPSSSSSTAGLATQDGAAADTGVELDTMVDSTVAPLDASGIHDNL